MRVFADISCKPSLLQIGDQILSINGRSTAGMSHSQAIEIIQSGGNQIRLLARRPLPSLGPLPHVPSLPAQISYTTGALRFVLISANFKFWNGEDFFEKIMIVSFEYSACYYWFVFKCYFDVPFSFHLKYDPP